MLNISRKIHCVRQLDETDCAAASIATLLCYYGKQVSVSNIREAIGTDKNGTSIYGIVAGLRHYCMKATAVNASSKKENLFTSRITLPCIAHVASEHNASHFVVLYEIKENSVSIADPDKGLIQLDRNSFLKIWHGNLIITIPTDEFTPDDKEDIKPAIILLNMFLSEKKASSILFLMSLILSICGIVYSYYYRKPHLMDTGQIKQPYSIFYCASYNLHLLSNSSALIENWCSTLNIYLCKTIRCKKKR